MIPLHMVGLSDYMPFQSQANNGFPAKTLSDLSFLFGCTTPCQNPFTRTPQYISFCNSTVSTLKSFRKLFLNRWILFSIVLPMEVVFVFEFLTWRGKKKDLKNIWSMSLLTLNSTHTIVATKKYFSGNIGGKCDTEFTRNPLKIMGIWSKFSFALIFKFRNQKSSEKLFQTCSNQNYCFRLTSSITKCKFSFKVDFFHSLFDLW